MNLVTLRDVGVAYDGYEALQHVDLEIAKNDFLGVIGPNGGGKTTLVKAILGTVPHTGEVRARTRTVPGQGAADRLHAPAIGFRPHVPHLGARSGIVGFAGAQGNFQPLYESRPRESARSAGNGGRGRYGPQPYRAKFRAARCSGRCCAEPSFPIPSC